MPKRKKKLAKKLLAKLPTEKSIPVADLKRYIWLVYGREKIGKTSLSAQFEDALHLMFEPGGKDHSIYQVTLDSWAAFRDIVKQLKSSSRFKTLVLDTVDVAYEQCFEWVCEKLAINHPSDEDWGKGWKEIEREWTRQLTSLQQTDRGVIYLSHEQVRGVKRRNGEESDRIMPSLSKGGRRIIEPAVDIWAYFCFNERNQRVLQIRGDDTVLAGTRLRNHFQGVDVIPMGNSPEEGYENLVKAFKNELFVEAKPPKKKAKRKKAKLPKRRK